MLAIIKSSVFGFSMGFEKTKYKQYKGIKIADVIPK